jgi:hypothetical protein
VVVTVPNENIDKAAELLRKALAVDPRTVELVGGQRWWTLRGRDLTGEWIEVRLPCIFLTNLSFLPSSDMSPAFLNTEPLY